MKYLNKIASAFSVACLGLLMLTSCEGGELYSLSAPDWISAKVDSIADTKKPEELKGMMEDVYTVGAKDFSTGWWSVWSKYYQIVENGRWDLQFNLGINPNASNTYKNFALIICNDADRGAGDYKEYGAIRFDTQPSGNSEWGDNWINERRSLVTSNLVFSTDTDKGIEKLAGKVTLTINRENGGLFVKMSNGTVTKTYTQTEQLPNFNEDASNGTIRAFLCPEGSYLDILATNVEPIGGCTSAEDKQPVSFVLKNVPQKVQLKEGLNIDTIMANVSATVTFEEGITKEVKAADLKFQAISDLASVGPKTFAAIYNKTYKGENCATPIMVTTTFNVVEKMFTCIGASDNSTAFWGAHSPYVKVNPKETFVTTFTNFTTCANNWNNFVTVLTNADGSIEYGVFRCDNWGWGTGWAGEELASKCTPSGGQTDWATWLAAMNGAKVTVYVTNNGDGTADLKTVMLGNDGVTYKQDYIGINTVTDPNNFYFHFTVDGSHIEFDDVVGAEDNSTAFWGAHSPYIKVPVGATYTRSFINNTAGANNWNNFVTVLTNSDGSTEYGVFRADNWGWGTGWAGEELASKCTPSGGQTDWAAWLSAMPGAKVTVSVTNNGDGTADLRSVMIGNDGVTYKQDYIGINTITDPNDLNMHFTVDSCHLIFE